MVSIILRTDVLIDQKHVAAGTVLDVVPEFARYLVGCGKAAYDGKPEQPGTPETAVVEPANKAVMPKAKKRQG